ncbi:hypothetical protein F5B22DRAFT_647844 [Xylaria bambusicola]|uniref:uncharacterized protein n=1 Tax=Xylaria bambusicola TaxID=326684 RepID=UPI0020083A12|nr:uncharacterized protein F5B22DRAFT_647844 [Xylaria bambusicola]KAI0513299.1 hypothetical protein F5B22DRAFT_647844 [Xylaria bambusicola]
MNNPEPNYLLNLNKYTTKTAEALAKYTGLIPGGGIAVSVHSRRAPKPSEKSVFGARVDHLILELVAMTGVKDLELKGEEWARGLFQELREAGTDNEKIYGSY